MNSTGSEEPGSPTERQSYLDYAIVRIGLTTIWFAIIMLLLEGLGVNPL